MTPVVRNLFSPFPTDLTNEVSETLVQSRSFRMERIVSYGQGCDSGAWYDQDRHEWVVLLRGTARMQFEGETEAVDLKAGDFIEIPAHQRHRVEWTASEGPAVWLALHYDEPLGCPQSE